MQNEFISVLKDGLEKYIPTLKRKILIVSAYVTYDAFMFVNDLLSQNCKQEVEKIIVLNFDLMDFFRGASYFKFKESIVKYSWKVYVNLKIHAKIYCFDDEKAIIGSANLTGSGIGLTTRQGKSIKEGGTVCDVNQGLLLYMQEVLKESIAVDENLADLLDGYVEKVLKVEKESEAEKLWEELSRLLREKTSENPLLNYKVGVIKKLEKKILSAIKENPNKFLEEVTKVELPIYYIEKNKKWYDNYIIDLDMNEFILERKYENLAKLYKLNGKLYREKIDVPEVEISPEKLRQLKEKYKGYKIDVVEDSAVMLGEKVIFKIFYPI
ncbi:PLD-like domain-containing protein [Thermosyntropha lipolytica DSM 11003]|uniref:PLD-like domain-containing protein n=1 Tax=Thermosyntropha lipolytica DSM 11003 TaxID=1123382 RepID=A0A1M5QXF2_9FIRM|nr:phospholipase D family protein [Thermosyntropha lipolytica]SHH18815.1 PLD-like domain-containing protein [Thermosyntropha lipolytica DSM 11003]